MPNRPPIPRSLFSRRRARNLIITAGLCAVLLAAVTLLDNSLWHSSFATGYLLLFSLFFLAAFNLRKVFPFLPGIGRASFWMQTHIYLGLSTFLMFGLHVTWRWPDGWLESLLALLYLLVALSGVYGLIATRLIPRRLTAVGNEVIYERIPHLRTELACEVRQTALGALASSEVMTRYYCNHLLAFFERPRELSFWLFPSSRRRKKLVEELSGLNRYLSTDQRTIGYQLTGLVQRKDDLDYHLVLQWRLKAWLFVHVGFTYSLLLVAIVHTVFVHAMLGIVP